MPSSALVNSLPGTYVNRLSTTTRALRPQSGSSAAFALSTSRGPLRVPLPVTNMSEAIRIFGKHRKGQAGMYALNSYFANGGRLAYVSRLAHYSDITDATTNAGATASLALAGVGQASAAVFTGNVDISTFAVSNSQAIVFSINGGSNRTLTFSAAAASRASSSGAARTLVDGTTITVAINGGAAQTVTFATAQFSDIAAATPAEIAAVMNAQLVGCSASVSGTTVVLTTDRKGSGASINVTGGTANGVMGYTTGNLAGTGNVPDASAVTFAQFKALFEAAIYQTSAGDITATQNNAGFLVLTTAATGASASIDLKSSGTTAALVTALGLSDLGTNDGGAATTGSDATSATAMTVYAGYRGYKSPGVAGNKLKVTLTETHKNSSAGAGDDLVEDGETGDTVLSMAKVSGLSEGSVLRITNTDDDIVAYHKVVSISTTYSGTSVTNLVTITPALADDFPANDTTVESVEYTLTVLDSDGVGGAVKEAFPDLNANPDGSRFIANVINDPFTGSELITIVDGGLDLPGYMPVEITSFTSLSGGTEEMTGFTAADIAGDATAKTGLHAYDDVVGFRRLAVPPSFGSDNSLLYVPSSAAAHRAIVGYAIERGDCEAILDAPFGYTAAQHIAYRNHTLGVDSERASLNAPYIKVADPLSTARNATVLIPQSSAICGMIDAVATTAPPAGGVHTAVAGETRGRLQGALGLEVEFNDAEHASMNAASINVIRNMTLSTGSGLVRWGARSLSSKPEYLYEQVNRLLTDVEQAFLNGTRWAVFEDNTPNLWELLKKSGRSLLNGYYSRGQLRGNNASEAFFVNVNGSTTSPADEEAGRLIGQFGISAVRPAEFIIWNATLLPAGGLRLSRAS